jgi:hypothetical protein
MPKHNTNFSGDHILCNIPATEERERAMFLGRVAAEPSPRRPTLLVCVKPQKPISVLFSLLGLRGKFLSFFFYFCSSNYLAGVSGRSKKAGHSPATMVLNDTASNDKYIKVEIDMYKSAWHIRNIRSTNYTAW